MPASPSSLRVILVVALLLALAAGAAVVILKSQMSPVQQSGLAPVDNGEDAHDHGQDSAATLEISEKGLRNIGFEPFTVAFRDYQRRLVLPAMVVEQPGRSQTHITAPLTGVITKINVVQGQAVTPGEPLFQMRLTHEELVAAQRDFLTDLANLEIVEREVARLKGLGDGVVPGKRIIDLQYERRKLTSALQAEEQAMLLHGLSKEQVDNIRNQKQLLQTVVVSTPGHTHDDENPIDEHPLLVQRLTASVGQQIQVGEEFAVLADHHVLLVEGSAFEDDAQAVRASAAEGRQVTAKLASGDDANGGVEGLEVQYVAGQVDPVSRAFKVYVPLPNKAALDKITADGVRFFEWKYKPGQRMQLSIPVERMPEQLVLPAAAVIDDGVETYVYRQNGDHFEQVAVHLLTRDKQWVVVANDGTLFAGDVIAGKGAFQIHLALKSQTGGGVDPHAGHNH